MLSLLLVRGYLVFFPVPRAKRLSVFQFAQLYGPEAFYLLRSKEFIVDKLVDSSLGDAEHFSGFSCRDPVILSHDLFLPLAKIMGGGFRNTGMGFGLGGRDRLCRFIYAGDCRRPRICIVQ